MLKASSNGGHDAARQTVAYLEARSRGDVYASLRSLGCPEVQARKAALYAELRTASGEPRLTPEVENRVVAQKLSILGIETRTTPPSTKSLEERVAEVGKLVLADKQVLAKRGENDDDEDAMCGDATCPRCGHEFSIFDEADEEEN
jgi:hypothetical protein